MSARRAPGLAFLVGTLLAAQTLGTVTTMTLPAVAPKVAETYGIIAFGLLALPAAVGLACVFAAHQISARVVATQAGS